jgi:hypothetical protein
LHHPCPQCVPVLALVGLQQCTVTMTAPWFGLHPAGVDLLFYSLSYDVPGFPWTVISNMWLSVSIAQHAPHFRASAQHPNCSTQKMSLCLQREKRCKPHGQPYSTPHVCIAAGCCCFQGSMTQAAAAVPISFFSGEARVAHILLAWQAQELKRVC